MPRTRTLPDHLVLERATQVFWRQGYAATSLRDLTRATSLSSAALYNRFSDKDGLFVEVLRHYADSGLVARLARLSNSTPPLEAIRVFYEELLSLSISDSERKGCLLVNTALDGAAVAPEARALVQARMEQLESFFRQQLQQAVNEGLLPSSTPILATATALLGLVFGLRVMARLDSNPERLRLLIEHSLAAHIPNLSSALPNQTNTH